jgi:hypothetical protein
MVTAEAYEILFHFNNDISLRGNSVCLDVQIKGDKIDGACSAHLGGEKCLQWSWLYVNVPELFVQKNSWHCTLSFLCTD